MKKRTILIVDDQIINRKILGKLLSEQYETLYAGDGEEALQILQEKAGVISAVLLDIVMPKMNGFAVLEAMSRDAVLSKIPVIVSSQMEGEEAEIQALSLGAQDFIAKPYKGDIIRQRLENIIRLRETAAMINKVEKDELTGLYNKQFFMEKATEEIQKNRDQKFDMICIGIERFKLINDTYGMAKGDEVLKYFAQLIQTGEEGFKLCGHFLADEYYLLLHHKDSYDGMKFKKLSEEINKFPIDMNIHIHCGVYAIANPDIQMSTICDRAKLAADKNRGKYDEYFSYYDESIRKKLMEEQFINSEMQTALEEGQFHVYYQPKYDLDTETVAGAEALVRWIHPEKGMLSPGLFIPIFESNGFITQLDQYVWESVCRDMRRWLDQGNHVVSVSVNVSRADIYNPKLIDIFLNLLAKYRIPMQKLHLEVTESAYTDNPDQIIEVVGKLRELGFVIEMDDFGSGYSSLNMLAEMPVDILKLDMKFIQNDSKKTSGKGILSFVISLAKWLNLAVVAEGVETSQQIASLRSMECNYVQGFYFARPMKREDFENLLKTSKTTEMIATNRTIEQAAVKPRTIIRKKDSVMLIVDDIEVNRAVLASTFYDEYDVVEKENGKEAWEYLIENYQKVDIIMLDLLMPVMDGFQLLEKIRNSETMVHIPVIITSQGDEDSEQRALELQADDFISKPYKTEIIRHRVSNVLANYTLQRMQGQKEQEKKSPITYEPQTLEEMTSYLEILKKYFDIVRLVDPRETLVCENQGKDDCNQKHCYSIWEKNSRCNNCISMKAMEERGRFNKLEYSNEGLYFVISQYTTIGCREAVIEMVTRLDDNYVDNVFDKKMLYLRLDQLHQSLEKDELTGVYNRRHIDRCLTKYIESCRSRQENIGIAMVDIDYFKELNDLYGHLAGDKVLLHVAQILESNIALSRGDFVARYGGDEFMIVCLNIAPEVFEKRMRAIAALVQHMDQEEFGENAIGVSIGCVNTCEFPENDMEALIKQADQRLYLAKRNNKGSVVARDDEK